jgi:hypothetical protein
MTSTKHREIFDFIYAKLLKNKHKIGTNEPIKCLLPNNVFITVIANNMWCGLSLKFGDRNVAGCGLENSHYNKSPCFFLWSLNCSEPFQSRGYASILLITAMALGKLNHHKYTLLSVSKCNLNALRLYRSMGYTPYPRSQSSFLMVAKI